MTGPGSYLLCGTPRTGSTLLCGLLASTGVAGRPESYFREPDEAEWARRFGIPAAADGTVDYRRFAEAARAAGSTPNGVFAARVMWGTMPRIVGGLAPAPRTRPDPEVLGEASWSSTGMLLVRTPVPCPALMPGRRTSGSRGWSAPGRSRARS